MEYHRCQNQLQQYGMLYMPPMAVIYYLATNESENVFFFLT